MTYLSCELSVFCFSVFWFRRAGYSGPQDGFSGFPDRSLRAPTRSLRVLLSNTLFWVNIMPYASHLSLHSPVHPTVKHIRAFVVLLIYMPKLLTCQVKFEIQKFMAYIKGELLYARCLLLYDYQMSYMWVVINHQKGGDWKWSRPLSGFWWIMTKHMYI